MNPPTDKAMKPTQTHTPGPQWCGAYKADGTLAAVLASESEAYYYIRNRSHMHGGTYRPFGMNPAVAPDLLAALEAMVIANHGLPANPAEEADPVCRAALEQARAAGQP